MNDAPFLEYHSGVRADFLVCEKSALIVYLFKIFYSIEIKYLDIVKYMCDTITYAFNNGPRLVKTLVSFHTVVGMNCVAANEANDFRCVASAAHFFVGKI